MKKKKFLEKATKVLEKKLEKRKGETLPECKIKKDLEQMELKVYDKMDSTDNVPLGTISVLNAYRSREYLDCSVKEIVLPWINKLVVTCEENFERVSNIREAFGLPSIDSDLENEESDSYEDIE